jgi:hypothetical protein
MTPAEFVRTFRTAADDLRIRVPAGKLSIRDGEVSDTFRYDLSENIGITGSVSKETRRIIRLAVVGTPKTDKDSSGMVACFGITLRVFNPKMDKQKRGELLLSLMNAKDGELNRDKTRIVGNIKYQFSTSKTAGIRFSVAGRDD